MYSWNKAFVCLAFVQHLASAQGVCGFSFIFFAFFFTHDNSRLEGNIRLKVSLRIQGAPGLFHCLMILLFDLTQRRIQLYNPPDNLFNSHRKIKYKAYKYTNMNNANSYGVKDPKQNMAARELDGKCKYITNYYYHKSQLDLTV